MKWIRRWWTFPGERYAWQHSEEAMMMANHAIRPKIPFQYQMTALDCVPTTILNALRYLFPREVIPPEAVALTNRVGMDEKSCWWTEEQLAHALNSIIDWLNRYDGKGKYKRFRPRVTIMENEAVVTEKIIAKKRIIIFIGLTYVISWLIFFLMPLCGITYGKA